MAPLVDWTRSIRLGPFRWGAVSPWRAARVATGVVAPLIIGWLSGHTEYGAYAALGALPAGFVSFLGESRSRLAAVAIASVGMATSTFIGGTTAALAPWLIVPEVAWWAFVTGLAISIGQWASVVALQWTVALLIAVGVSTGPKEAAFRAGLVLAGGLLQGLLVTLSWALRPGSTERSRLADAYRALASYASELAAGHAEPPRPAAFAAGSTVEDPNPLLSRSLRLAFLDLLEEAERIRAALAALAAHASDESPPHDQQFRNLLAEVTGALNLTAAAMDSPRGKRADMVRRLQAAIDRLAIVADPPWRWAGEALLGQLRSVQRILANLDSVVPQGGTTVAARREPLRFGLRDVASAFATMRANVTTTTEAGRHALRLAAVATLAQALAQATGLYQGRWVTLTILLVLRPDYGSTIYRGVQRAAGTMLGAGLAAVVAQLVQEKQDGLIATASLCIAAAYALFDASYLLFSLFITAFIVVLLSLMGQSLIPTAEARILDTVIGSVLALAGYLAWPTWEGVAAQHKFARLLEAHRDYGTALLQEAALPASMDAMRLRALQDSARRVRSNAEAAAARLADEPAHDRFPRRLAERLSAAVARLANAELALHALVVSRQLPSKATGGAPGLDDFSTAFATAMTRLAAALDTLQPPESLPALRPLQAALRDDQAARDTPLLGITDRIVDATNTLDAILSDQLKPH
jgi:uncharacterized membrane protein YccC